MNGTAAGAGGAREDRLRTVFLRAVALPSGDREAYVAEACADDPDLLREVRALLAADERLTTRDILGTPLPASPLLGTFGAPLGAGEQVGPYRILRPLGHGGMGRVYLAERADVGKTVALKLLHTAFASPEATRRFLIEQRVLARLDHPHIARFLDAGLAPGGVPYFAMEFVDGEPLLAHAARLPLARRVECFVAVCSAVAYAHQHLVVHRDLKPSNVHVDRHGTVKLLDFGIAKLLEDEDEERTRADQRLMTPDYAAPEQMRGEAITPATDVYSLGLLFFELLTGGRPYSVRDASPAEAERIVARTEAPRPSTKMPAGAIPARAADDLDAICLRALEKAPARRYPTAAELEADLRRHLAHRPVEARVPTAAYLLRKFVARHRLAVGAVATAGVLVLAGVTGVVSQARRAEAERVRADAERARAEQALAGSQGVTEFLIGLFEAYSPASAMGRAPSLADLVARGQQQADQLSGQPLVQARLLETIGRVQHAAGKFAEAEVPLRRALAIRRAELGPAHADIAATAHALANLLFARGQHAEAESLFEEALVMRRAVLGPGHPDVAETLGVYGLLVLRMHLDDDRAEQMISEALAIQRRSLGDRDPRVAVTTNLLGAVSDHRGDTATTERLLREALAIQRERLGPAHPNALETLANLAVVLYDKGEPAAAEAIAREALALNRKVYGDWHPEVGINLNNLANFVERRGDLVEADSLYRQAIAILEPAIGRRHPRAARIISNHARTLARRGRYREAEGLYLESIETMVEVFGAGSPQVDALRERLADMYDEARRPRDAAAQRALVAQ